MNITNIVSFVTTNWVTIIAGMVLADRVLQFIATITGNKTIDNIAVTIANLITKIPAQAPKIQMATSIAGAVFLILTISWWIIQNFSERKKLYDKAVQDAKDAVVNGDTAGLIDAERRMQIYR